MVATHKANKTSLGKLARQRRGRPVGERSSSSDSNEDNLVQLVRKGGIYRHLNYNNPIDLQGGAPNAEKAVEEWVFAKFGPMRGKSDKL